MLSKSKPEKAEEDAQVELPPMRALSTFTNGVWSHIFPSKDGEETEGCRNELHQNLVEFMRSDNLIVLTGLGTSLCVTNEEGIKPAPTMKQLWLAVREVTGDKTFDEILKNVRFEGEEFNIEELLSRCQTANAFIPSEEIETFIKTAEKTIAKLCRFISHDLELPHHETFLRKIARRSTTSPRTRIFTTNYDLCFEASATRNNMIVVDGFSHSIPQEFDGEYFSYDLVKREESGNAPNFIPNVFQLYKLHGSVDWERVGDRIQKKHDTEEPVLIYPRYSKFESSYEHPFLELLSRFQTSIRQPKTSLLIAGFGFNDKHITQPILSAIYSNVGLRVVVVDPFLEVGPSDAAKNITSLIKQGDPRLTLLTTPFEEFIQLLPDLVSETEYERHQLRLRGMSS